MYYWLCSKCSTLLQNNSQPNSSNCPSGSSHNWSRLGNSGGKYNWQCKKCSTLVQTDSQPNSSNCPLGASHSWTRL